VEALLDAPLVQAGADYFDARPAMDTKIYQQFIFKCQWKDHPHAKSGGDYLSAKMRRAAPGAMVSAIPESRRELTEFLLNPDCKPHKVVVHMEGKSKYSVRSWLQVKDAEGGPLLSILLELRDLGAQNLQPGLSSAGSETEEEEEKIDPNNPFSHLSGGGNNTFIAPVGSQSRVGGAVS
jgi:hypothetical protein